MKTIIVNDNEIPGGGIHLLAETELDLKAIKIILLKLQFFDPTDVPSWGIKLALNELELAE